MVSSLLTYNYFTPFPSSSDFEQVNICWENYLTFYLLDICFKQNISYLNWAPPKRNK